MTVLNLTKIIIFSRRWGFSLPLLKLKSFYNIINQFIKKSGILFLGISRRSSVIFQWSFYKGFQLSFSPIYDSM